MSQKKFGQFKVVIWWPLPDGGRYEEWTERNMTSPEFAAAVNVGMTKPGKSSSAFSDDAAKTPRTV